jgi:hypothetical protein
MTALSHLHLAPADEAVLDPLHGHGFRGSGYDVPTGVARTRAGRLETVDPFPVDPGVAPLYTPAAVMDDTGIYGSGPLSGRAPQTTAAFGPGVSAFRSDDLDDGPEAALVLATSWAVDALGER